MIEKSAQRRIVIFVDQGYSSGDFEVAPIINFDYDVLLSNKGKDKNKKFED